MTRDSLCKQMCMQAQSGTTLRAKVCLQGAHQPEERCEMGKSVVFQLFRQAMYHQSRD